MVHDHSQQWGENNKILKADIAGLLLTRWLTFNSSLLAVQQHKTKSKYTLLISFDSPFNDQRWWKMNNLVTLGKSSLWEYKHTLPLMKSCIQQWWEILNWEKQKEIVWSKYVNDNRSESIRITCISACDAPRLCCIGNLDFFYGNNGCICRMQWATH